MAYTTINKIQTTIYGEVYKCFDTKRSCPIALKLSQSLKHITRGENPLGEATILSSLRSSTKEGDGKQYIIQLLETFETKVNGISYFCAAFEFADGGDLLDKVLNLANQKQRLSFSRIRKYFTMLAKGVQFIHQHNICHLDLSLENILLTKTDEVRICDFGQAQTQRIVHDRDLRRGKPKYMSPEVYRLQRYDGFKADVWSMGIILWGMITGTLVYQKASLRDPRFAILAKSGEDGVNLLLKQDEVPDVPPSLVCLMSRMLDINPETRYSIEDVLVHPWVKVEQKPAI